MKKRINKDLKCEIKQYGNEYIIKENLHVKIISYKHNEMWEANFEYYLQENSDLTELNHEILIKSGFQEITGCGETLYFKALQINGYKVRLIYSLKGHFLKIWKISEKIEIKTYGVIAVYQIKQIMKMLCIECIEEDIVKASEEIIIQVPRWILENINETLKQATKTCKDINLKDNINLVEKLLDGMLFY